MVTVNPQRIGHVQGFRRARGGPGVRPAHFIDGFLRDALYNRYICAWTEAARIAAAKGVARVHLDAVLWPPSS